MKRRLFVTILVLALAGLQAMAQGSFRDFFSDSTLYVSINVRAEEHNLRFSDIKFDVRDKWSGPLRDRFRAMQTAPSRISMISQRTGDTIYQGDYSTLLGEWMELDISKGSVNECNQCVKLPCPRRSVDVVLERLDPGHGYLPVFTASYSPNGKDNRTLAQMPYSSRTLLDNGDPHTHVDITILSEGYTRAEMASFDSICDIFVQKLFMYEPFKSMVHRFNIRAVQVPSFRSGVSAENLQVPTILGFKYDTFGMDRYVATYTQYMLMLASAIVDTDHVIVFANSKRYGGGGIYNQYAVFAGKNSQTIEGVIHELGHSFANLEDEYEGDVFSSKEVAGSKCIMRTLSERHFCPKCQKQIKKAIDYWSE